MEKSIDKPEKAVANVLKGAELGTDFCNAITRTNTNHQRLRHPVRLNFSLVYLVLVGVTWECETENTAEKAFDRSFFFAQSSSRTRQRLSMEDADRRRTDDQSDMEKIPSGDAQGTSLISEQGRVPIDTPI